MRRGWRSWLVVGMTVWVAGASFGCAEPDLASVLGPRTATQAPTLEPSDPPPSPTPPPASPTPRPQWTLPPPSASPTRAPFRTPIPQESTWVPEPTPTPLDIGMEGPVVEPSPDPE